MTSRAKWILGLTATLVAAIGISAGAAYRRIAIDSAPARRAVTSRSPAAEAADERFWETFHGGRYDRIQGAIDQLAQAYVATPNDPITAGHLGWMHIWRISERARLDSTPASIIEDMLLARQYFDESVRLNPSDARTLGFLASALMGEGAIQHDERLTRTGYFTMLDAIKAWPAFNLFTGGYVLSGAPVQSSRFREGLEWEWRDLNACVGHPIDRAHPDFTALLSKVKDVRACLNTSIAPHNAEGFFLNMGDMLVKSGDWRTAQTMYGNAKLVPEYSTWPFAAVLDERIRTAEINVARFSGPDPNPRTGMMGDSAFSCMACHQR
jgi:hypothetical protein